MTKAKIGRQNFAILDHEVENSDASFCPFLLLSMGGMCVTDFRRKKHPNDLAFEIRQ